jgi:hypothetical protein
MRSQRGPFWFFWGPFCGFWGPECGFWGPFCVRQKISAKRQARGVSVARGEGWLSMSAHGGRSPSYTHGRWCASEIIFGRMAGWELQFFEGFGGKTFSFLLFGMLPEGDHFGAPVVGGVLKKNAARGSSRGAADRLVALRRDTGGSAVFFPQLGPCRSQSRAVACVADPIGASDPPLRRGRSSAHPLADERSSVAPRPARRPPPNPRRWADQAGRSPSSIRKSGAGLS